MSCQIALPPLTSIAPHLHSPCPLLRGLFLYQAHFLPSAPSPLTSLHHLQLRRDPDASSVQTPLSVSSCCLGALPFSLSLHINTGQLSLTISLFVTVNLLTHIQTQWPPRAPFHPTSRPRMAPTVTTARPRATWYVLNLPPFQHLLLRHEQRWQRQSSSRWQQSRSGRASRGQRGRPSW